MMLNTSVDKQEMSVGCTNLIGVLLRAGLDGKRMRLHSTNSIWVRSIRNSENDLDSESQERAFREDAWIYRRGFLHSAGTLK